MDIARLGLKPSLLVNIRVRIVLAIGSPHRPTYGKLWRPVTMAQLSFGGI